MSGSNNKLSKIYDFRSVGAGNAISDIKKINEQLQQSVDLKKKLNDLMNKSSDGSSSRKYKTEVENVEKAEGKLVVKMNDRIRSTMKLAKHNKELQLEIKHVADEIGRTTDALNEQNKAEVKAIQEAQAFYKTQQQVTKSTEQRTQKTRDLKKETLENKLIEQQRTQALKNQIREELNAKGSLEQRRAALIRLRAEYDRLSPLERDTSWGKRMATTIVGLNTQVLELEKSTGRSQRNVGNYTSALGKVWSGLSKIAYLVPGLGIAGIFNLALEAILPFLPKLDLLNNKMAEFQTTLVEGRKAAMEETTELEQLYKITQDTSRSIDERTAAVNRLQDLYPAYFGNISNENILNGDAVGIYNALRQSILDVAKATALKSRIVEIQNENLDEQLRLEKKLQDAVDDEFKNRGKTRIINYGFQAGPMGETGLVQIDDKYRYEKSEAAGKELEDFNKRQEEKMKIYQDSLDRMLGFDLKAQQDKDKKEDEATAKSQARLEKALQARSEKERREAEKRAKEQEAIDAINFQNRLNLMDDMAAEIAKREKQYQDEIGSGANQKLAKESLEKDLLEIKIKYHQAYMQELEAQYNEETKRQNEIDEEKKRNALALSKNMDEIDQFREDQRMARYERELEQEKQQAEKLKKNQEDRKKAIEYFYQSSLDLAAQYFRNQSQLAAQESDDRYQDVLKFQDGEKQKRLAQAQSAAEKEAIENEYKQKADKAERQRNIERQEIARKQLYIEWAVASLKALSTSNNIYDGLAKEAIVTGEFLLALQSLNSQKFEDGGSVPTSTGGDITGPSHAFGGVPFNYEAEGGEMAIINKNSTMDKGKYTVSGTPRQIASAINELGGGIRFAPGATAAKFEYGGLLGSNLTAPVMSAPVVTSSMSELSYSQGKAMEQAIDNKIRTLKVTLNPHDVRSFNNDYNKNVNVAVL